MYLYFKCVGHKPKTDVYEVRTKRNDFVLGIVRWYGAWRQYCFFPVDWQLVIKEIKATLKVQTTCGDNAVLLPNVLAVLENHKLVFSKGCMNQINEFIDKLMNERRRKATTFI